MRTLSKPAPDRARVLRFGAVGLVNTALGYTVIVAGLRLGLGDVAANGLGYAVGLVSSYVLNSRWTFRGQGTRDRGAPVRFALAFLVAYGANLAVVMAGRAVGFVDDPLVHLAGIAAYTAVFYGASASFVFRGASTVAAPLARAWPEALTLALLGAAWFHWRGMSLSHDVVWQLWIARQLIGGSALYSQILELNPPLWFWLAVPVQFAAQTLGIGSKAAIVSAVFTYIAFALGLLAALSSDLPPVRRALLLAFAVIATVIAPLSDFAQREHLALIGSLPYVALLARRAEGKPVPWRLAALAGAAAALGFALKHYFLVAPVLLELWLIVRHRTGWTPLRPELFVLCGAAAAYAIAVLALTPEYLTTIVPLLNLAYEGYKADLWPLATSPTVLGWVTALGILLSVGRDRAPLAVAAAVAAVGFAIAYFVQRKGWLYHSLPATSLFVLALGAMLLQRRSFTVLDGLRAAAVLAIVAVLLPMSYRTAPYTNPWAGTVADLMRKVAPGGPVLMLTAHPSRIWPMIEDEGHRWPSRHFAFWMLAAIAQQLREEGALSPELQALAARVRRETVTDILCNPPAMILVDDFTRSKANGIEPVAFFNEDPGFREIFAHYSEAESRGGFTAFVPAGDWRPPAPREACREIH